ncbi:MAG: hypothetical protein KAR11_08210 [Phycisphaerae bacterium]|nr:hypothetical protein [Phycisphaerae bacterium]
MSEIKIARFVGIAACKNIFSDKSTFVLRSPEHYERLYEISEGNDGKGDRSEGGVQTCDGGTANFKSFVASCWTRLEGNKPTSDEWDIFKKGDQNIVAIISSPSKICEFLDNVLETKKEKYSFYQVKHENVDYDGVQERIDDTSIREIVPFHKENKFSHQKEYRFILRYASSNKINLIDTFIFCGGIDYMETCFVNPNICEEQKQKLQDIIQMARAGYGDFFNKTEREIITNAEVLFPYLLKP